MMNVKKEPFPEHNEHFADCICFELRRTMRLVTQYYDQFFQSTGIRPTQFPILAALLYGPYTITELSDLLTLEHSTLVRSVRPLQEAGLITLSKGKDRRVRYAELTELGHQKIEEITPLWRAAQAGIIDPLSDQKWSEIKGHLKAIRKIIYQNETPL